MKLPLVLMLLVTAVAWQGCQGNDPHSPQALLRMLDKACAHRDPGLVMTKVDFQYTDDLGGRGRLEDDLRQLFTVYGRLLLRVQDVEVSKGMIRGHAVVEGKRIRYEGPLLLEIDHLPAGWQIRSGLMTDLRGILYALRERRIALESGSWERLELVTSPEYRGGVGGRTDLIERVRSDLAAVQVRALMVDDVDIVVQQDRARVLQSYLLITQVGAQKTENHDRERLRLRREGSSWRFIGGLG